MRKSLEKVIEIFGSQTALAKALSPFSPKKRLRQSNISTWLRKNKNGVPAEYLLPIERITNGAIRASDLRPDLYPPSLMSRPASEPVPHAGNVVRKSRKGLRGGMQGVARAEGQGVRGV